MHHVARIWNALSSDMLEPWFHWPSMQNWIKKIYILARWQSKGRGEDEGWNSWFALVENHYAHNVMNGILLCCNYLILWSWQYTLHVADIWCNVNASQCHLSVTLSLWCSRSISPLTSGLPPWLDSLLCNQVIRTAQLVPSSC